MRFLLLSSFVLVIFRTEVAAAENIQFDPDSAQELFCAIPPLQRETHEAPSMSTLRDYCFNLTGSLSEASEQQLSELATAYAPYLFFHPLEHYTMSSVNRVFQDSTAGTIMYQDPLRGNIVFDETLNQTSLLRSTRNLNLGLNKQRYFFQRNLDDAYVSGDGFDANGKSRAPIYYTVTEINNTWVFHYYHFYTYHGTSTMGVVAYYRNNTTYTSFQVRPIGEHEADWQTLGVMACPSIVAQTPLAISFEQANSRDIADCTRGECVLYRNTAHPVGFVAMDTHYTYPTSANNLVMSQFNVEFFYNLGGVFQIERTNYLNSDGTFEWFEPNASNVIKLLLPSDITNTTDESEYWQGFAGRWGGSDVQPYEIVDINSTEVPDTVNVSHPKCINDIGTDAIECPTKEDDPVFYLVNQLLGSYPTSIYDTLIRYAKQLITSVLQNIPGTGQSPRGPAANPSFQTWLPPVNSSIRNKVGNTTSEIFCDLLKNMPNTDTLHYTIDIMALAANVRGIIAYCTLMVTLNVIAFAHPKLRGENRPILFFDDNGVVHPPDRALLLHIYRPAILYGFFYFFTVAGILLYFSGFVKMIHTIKDTTGIEIDSLATLSYLFGLVVILIDTVMMVFIWFPTRSCWIEVNVAYYEVIGDKIMSDKYRRKLCCGGSGSLVTFQFMYGALFNSLILAVMCVFIGSIDVGLVYTLSKVCSTVLGSLNGVCLDFPAVGIAIKCGPDFSAFCSAWNGSEAAMTLWGAVVIVSGNYYLIGSAGAASCIFRAVPEMLCLLPSNDLYKHSLSQSLPTEKDEIQSENGVDTSNDKQEQSPPMADESLADVSE